MEGRDIAAGMAVLSGDAANQLAILALIELAIDTGLHDDSIDVLLHLRR